MKKLLFLLPVFALATGSCKKPHDGELPALSVTSPANGAQLNVLDTLHVAAHMSDNDGLLSLDVKLVTQAFVPVLNPVSMTLSGTSQDVSFDYPINNIRITSGSYYLAFDVRDENNNLRRTYVALSITEIPRRLNGFFAATIPVAGTLHVLKCDTTWTPSVWSNSNSDFTDLAVSDYWQQVYVNGAYTGPLKATSIDGSSGSFSIPSIAGPSPYWGPMSVKDGRLWVSYPALGQVKSLDAAGGSNLILGADPNFYPVHQLQIGERVFTEQKDISSAAVRFVVHSTAGGSIQETPMSVNAVALFEKDADNVYVVGNGAGQGHLLIYDATNNGFWEPIVLPAGTVSSATQVDANTLLIAMSNSNVYKFTYAPVGLLTWTSGISPTQLRYDDVDNTVFSAEGANVKVYNYNPFSLQRSITMPETVQDLELWFNR